MSTDSGPQTPRDTKVEYELEITFCVIKRFGFFVNIVGIDLTTETTLRNNMANNGLHLSAAFKTGAKMCIDNEGHTKIKINTAVTGGIDREAEVTDLALQALNLVGMRYPRIREPRALILNR